MAKVKGKQLNQLVGQSAWDTSGVTLPATGSTKIVTSVFTGNTPGGSNTVAGIYTTAPQNRVFIRRKSDGVQIADPASGQIFARLTEAANVWTLTFYTLVAGSEVAFDFTGHADASAAIDFRWCESVQISAHQPTTVVNNGEFIDEFQASSPLMHQHIQEPITITSNGQTAFTLAQTPKDDNDVKVTINGVEYDNGVDFSVTATALTWNDVDFTLETTDKLLADYEY